MNSIVLDLLEEGSESLRVPDSLNQFAQLVAGQDFNDSGEHGTILELIHEQGPEIIGGQDRDNVIQETV